jgi:5-formyltetrahydrofolate cyclo-ligase
MKNKNSPEIIRFLKKDIRQKVRDKIKNLPAGYREKSSRLIAEKFLHSAHYINLNNILIYYPSGSEVDTTVIIEEALKNKKSIILPRVCDEELELYFVSDPEAQLEKGAYRIMEPVPSLCRPAKISDIDVVIVPGISFDKNFNRLGQGGGYFDRFLPRLPEKVKKIALCFDIQIVDTLPVMEHDAKVDIIITESRIYGPL